MSVNVFITEALRRGLGILDVIVIKPEISKFKLMVFETQGKQPNCLRIIKNDFKSEFYPAGTLRDKTWLELKRNLESRGVPVRNECIYEE